MLLVESKTMTRTFTAVLHKEGDLFVAECPEVGTVSQGADIEEAIRNLQEATEVYLEEFPMEQPTRPFVTTFEVAVHA
jgi:predicted RNase H-like HicB family nuclease